MNAKPVFLSLSALLAIACGSSSDSGAPSTAVDASTNDATTTGDGGGGGPDGSNASDGAANDGGNDGSPPSDGSVSPGVETIVSGLDPVTSISVFSGYVYWSEHPILVNTNLVRRAPLAVGATPEPIATAQDGPDCVTADASGVYWLQTSNDLLGYVGSAVMSAPLAGGLAPTKLADASHIFAPTVLALDATHIYVGNSWDHAADAGAAGPGMWRMDCNGSNLTRLGNDGSFEGHHIGISPTTLVWSSPHGVEASALDGSGAHIVWAPGNFNSPPNDVGTDGTNFFVAIGQNGRIVSGPLDGDGGAATDIVPKTANTTMRGVRVDGGRVFYYQSDDSSSPTVSSIVSVTTTGSDMKVYATGQKRVFDIALDADYVYWSTANAILRAPR